MSLIIDGRTNQNPEIIMKQLIVGLILAAFVLMPVARAGEGKTSDKSKSTCADKAACADKTACADKAKVSASAKTACTEKAACCAGDKSARKVANPDAKGAMFLAKR